MDEGQITNTPEERLARLERLVEEMLRLAIWSREEEGYDWIKRDLEALQKREAQ